MALSYTSNAIEGNTLSHQETAQVIEKNITIGGKTVVEHLEAINHAKAIDLIEKKAREKTRKELTVDDILDIHRCILRSIDDANAGVFIPELMQDLIAWITTASCHPAQIAADAHLKLVFIYPFVDGNGRTARLLLNLVLLQSGYPLTIIQQEERMAYINAIETALLTGQCEDYYRVIFEAVEKSLDFYLEALAETES